LKISIITVCYNSSKTILYTIKSVNDQSYKNIEHVFVDGLSIDNTLELIKLNSKRNTKIISEKDNSLYDAMNKGIKIASGDIIAILNSDDIFASNDIISKVMNFINETKSDIVYGNINYVNKNGNIVRVWNSSSFKRGSFASGWHPPHPSLFLKKSVYECCGLFDLNLKIASDFEFMLRIFENYDFKIEFLDMFFVNMKTGGKSNSIIGIFKGMNEIKLAFKKNKIKPDKLYFLKRYLTKLMEYFK